MLIDELMKFETITGAPAEIMSKLREIRYEFTIIKIQNVSDYLHSLKQEMFRKEDFDNVAPPFPYTWMEWSLSNSSFGALLCDKSYIDIGPAAPNGAKWNCNSLIFTKFHKNLFLLGGLDYSVGEDGRMVELSQGRDYSAYSYDDRFQELGNGVHSAMFAPWMALSFLHCKNVVVEKSAPTPLKLQRARARSGKPPISRYHTLRIGGFKERREGATPVAGEYSGKSLHICRGHFNRYGPEFGKGLLFGKHSGRFWIPSHTKGSDEIGTVEKDYLMEPKEVS